MLSRKYASGRLRNHMILQLIPIQCFWTQGLWAYEYHTNKLVDHFHRWRPELSHYSTGHSRPKFVIHFVSKFLLCDPYERSTQLYTCPISHPKFYIDPLMKLKEVVFHHGSSLNSKCRFCYQLVCSKLFAVFMHPTVWLSYHEIPMRKVGLM